jgi:TolB protein
MMKRIFILAAIAAAGSAVIVGQQPPPASPPPPQQQSEFKIVISGPSGLPPKLAIAGFIPLSQDAETVAAAKTIAEVLYDDINYEREYYMIGKDTIATIPKPASIDSVPLDRWKEVNCNGVIVGTVRKTATGVVVQVKLIDVTSGKTAFGKEYSGSIANPRRYAHTFSDEMFQDQLVLRGVARTKLAFSSDRQAELTRGPVKNRDTQEIYIVDYDGANPVRVTNTTTLNVAPAWSPDNQVIAYTSWRPSSAGSFGVYQDIILSYITTGVRDAPAKGDPAKQNYLPAWSPDGTKLAFTSQRDGNPEIYVMNKDGSGLRRMTNNPAIDVSPTWSPTGNQIAWTSDRTGKPKIYVMNADGTGQRTLVGDPDSDRPTWSRGKFNEIAYASKTGPGYDIKIYSFATGEATKITDGIGSNESPAFSPNGRHIAFTSTRNGKAQLFTVDRDGNNLRQITHEGNNKFASWSQ